MRNLRGTVLLAWVICAIVSILAIFGSVSAMVASRESGRPLPLDWIFLEGLTPLFFSVPAALIISRQPRNIIGWLLMTPALSIIPNVVIGPYLAGFQTAPPPATLPILVMIWISSASWLALIFPLLLIPVLFPTGRPLTRRWRWVLYLAGAMILFFFFWTAGTRIIEPEFASWRMENPYGYLPVNAADTLMLPWSGMLAVLTAASLASMVMRYRRAGVLEREQMKWLLYACSIFGLVYIPSVFLANRGADPGLQELSNLLFGIAIIAIPTAIAIAILRYHLFDIDVIIRLTLVYATVTGLLGLVYAGGIVLLQFVFRKLTGQASDLAVVVTTLAIAALFNPLRLRIQALIDRRYYRAKYNADQALAELTNAARSGSDLDELSSMLIELVLKTLQPAQVSLQLKAGERIEAVPRKDHPPA